MPPDLAALVPTHKSDTEKVRAIVALGYPAVAPIIPRLLEWMQDLNWPVAQELHPFLASIGAPLAPEVRRILETDDETWKFWILGMVVAESAELAALLRPELGRLAAHPTPDEREEGLHKVARAILDE